MTHFSDLGLAEPILRAVKDTGYDTPTPIQAQSIPSLLAGHDLLGIAQTGTGKTAAFALPILNKLLADRKRPEPKTCQALVLAPTRELALQIAENFRAYAKHTRMRVEVVIGGVKPGPQVRAMARGAEVLVATPGRLLDHVGTGAIKLDHVQTVVLDEADHMLDLGFLVPIRRILKLLPKVRQNLFFSATMPGPIGTLAGEMLRDPIKVQVTPVATTAEKVDQSVYLIEKTRKRDLLQELMSQPEVSRALVFSRTKRGADRIAKQLTAGGVAAAAIHGNKSQNQREKALAGFKNGKVRVLVATDIAARGIDVDGVSHVVNYDLPEVAESYVHRIGRTARGGAAGVAYAFCSDEEQKLLREIEKTTRQSLPVTDRRAAGGEAYVPASDTPAPKKRGRKEKPAQKERPAQKDRPAQDSKPQRERAPRRERGEKPAAEAQSRRGRDSVRRQADEASDNPVAGLDRMLGNTGRRAEPQTAKPQTAKPQAKRQPAQKQGKAAPVQKAGNGKQVTGTVKWFNARKGFGFVSPDQGGDDVFLHIRAVEGAGMTPPKDGAKIAFEIATDARKGKPEAINIRAA